MSTQRSGASPLRRTAPPSPGRLLGALAAVLGLALIAWASLAEAPILALPSSTGTAGSEAVPAPAATAVETQAPLPPDVTDPGYSDTAWRVIAVLMALIAVAAVLTVVVLILRGLLRRLRAARDPQDDALVDDAALDLSVLTQERAARQARLLTEGAPRNAVVATWLELERTVADAGVVRLPTETSSELAVRVLSTASAPADSLTDLAGLFREARFSRHELTEAHRRRAVADLERVHTALGVGPRASSPGAAPEVASDALPEPAARSTSDAAHRGLRAGTDGTDRP